MRLLEGVAKSKGAGRFDMPSYRAVGLAGVGTFVVYNEVEGERWIVDAG